MNNTLRATVLLAISVAALGAPSYARPGTINGYVVDVVDSGSYEAPDFITVFGPQGKEQITVTCAPFKWNSYGYNNETFVNSIATEWCF